jgi:hypothetical protein
VDATDENGPTTSAGIVVCLLSATSSGESPNLFTYRHTYGAWLVSTEQRAWMILGMWRCRLLSGEHAKSWSSDPRGGCRSGRVGSVVDRVHDDLRSASSTGVEPAH